MAIFVSIIALIILVYVAYKNYFEKAKIEISVGESINLVPSSGGQSDKVHLNCTFVNKGAKLGKYLKKE